MSRADAPTPLPCPPPLPPLRLPLPPLLRIRRVPRTLHLGLGLGTLLAALPVFGSGFQPVESIRSAAEGALSDAGARVEASVDPGLRMPACAAALQAQAISAVNVEVQCPGGWRLFVPVRVTRVQPVLVLSEAVAPGQPVPAGAVLVETRDAGRLAGVPLTDPAQAVGQVLRRGGRAGQVLTRADIVVPPLMRRGEPVSLVAGRDGFEVRMAGRVLADAGPGQVVRVENLSSRRVLSGVATGPGEVRVGH